MIRVTIELKEKGGEIAATATTKIFGTTTIGERLASSKLEERALCAAEETVEEFNKALGHPELELEVSEEEIDAAADEAVA